MKNYEIIIKGMMCEGCENRVKNGLKTIDGVNEVNANHKTGKVVISADEDVRLEELEEKIDDLGYEVIK